MSIGSAIGFIIGGFVGLIICIVIHYKRIIADLKQSLDWANERESENAQHLARVELMKENYKHGFTEQKATIAVLRGYIHDLEKRNEALKKYESENALCKNYIRNLIIMIDHISDEFRTIRQGDIRYRSAEQILLNDLT